MHPVQFHATAAETILYPDLFRPPSNYCWNKPEVGTGLWTSTFDPEICSDWIRWNIQEQYYIPDEGKWHGFKLEPAPHARIFTINTVKDLLNLLADYELPNRFDRPGDPFAGRIRFIDYEKMRHDYDGIHLTRAGEDATRYSVPNLYGWDVECTLWLNWAFMDVIPFTWVQPGVEGDLSPVLGGNRV